VEKRWGGGTRGKMGEQKEKGRWGDECEFCEQGGGEGEDGGKGRRRKTRGGRPVPSNSSVERKGETEEGEKGGRGIRSCINKVFLTFVRGERKKCGRGEEEGERTDGGGLARVRFAFFLGGGGGD